ncbi:MAG TPA: TolC family protein [Caulobacteraceae bacterium]|nr:TolC family protein [Caulobacteraceae bacterium]
MAGGLTLAAAVSLGGCATYHAAPLATAADDKPAIAALRVEVASLRVAPLKPIVVDARDGLDPMEVAVLAVLNNPDLQAKRAALKVSEAEVFAAGLLPDPQITLDVANPISGPDTLTAYGVAASFDVAGMLARANARNAARSTARQADLDLLWAEWTTAQQARQLAETVLANERRAAFLKQVLDLAADRAGRTQAALEHRDVDLQTAAADLAVKLDAQTQLAAAEHDAQKARRDLNALLNLDAGVAVLLTPDPRQGAYDEATLSQALASLPARRPDLLALQAGYQAADAKLRGAILAQFPLGSIGAAFARDTAGAVTTGVSAVLNLPIFNGGRGVVRTQTATREQLRAEYQARLDQTKAETVNAEAELVSARIQAEALRTEVPRLEALIRPAVAAYGRGDIDSQTYLTLSQNALSRRADLDQRELTARLAVIALESALFLPPASSRVSP